MLKAVAVSTVFSHSTLATGVEHLLPVSEEPPVLQEHEQWPQVYRTDDKVGLNDIYGRGPSKYRNRPIIIKNPKLP